MTTNGSKGLILVVDDNAEFRKIYGDRLRHDGYTVEEAVDGGNALEKIRANIPDLVLTDIVMPNKNGFALVEELKADAATRDIPVIVLSVMGEEKEIQKGLSLGAADYLVKGTYTPNDILSKIAAQLARGDVQKSAPKYRLFVKPNQGDAAKIAKDLGIAASFQCERCDTERALELIPDIAHDGWFQARFVCECP